MNDDLNTPIVIAQLFEGARIINNIIAGNATISAEDLKDLKEVFHTFCFDILGLKEEIGSSDGREAAYGKVVDMLLEQRVKAKANKDWATSDLIRNELTALGFEIKDTKDGFEWKLNKQKVVFRKHHRGCGGNKVIALYAPRPLWLIQNRYKNDSTRIFQKRPVCHQCGCRADRDTRRIQQSKTGNKTRTSECGTTDTGRRHLYFSRSGTCGSS